jgi:hypothetical protein
MRKVQRPYKSKPVKVPKTKQRKGPGNRSQKRKERR